MNEEANERTCPLCGERALKEGETYCYYCRNVLDQMFPEGWQTMPPEDIEEFYRCEGYQYDGDEGGDVKPEMLPEYGQSAPEEAPSELDKWVKRIIIIAGVLALLMLGIWAMTL